MPLDKQINIYSVDTGNFYSNRERRLHRLNHKLKSERNALKSTLQSIIKELSDFGMCETELKNIDTYDYKGNKEYDLLLSYQKVSALIGIKNEKIQDSKEQLSALLSRKVEANIAANGNHHTRFLNENTVSQKNVISVFDSFLTRTMNLKQDELTEDFMVVQVYYFDIIKDLIYHGFTYKGERYIYFSSSAGQIRTKKTVFIKESVWKKIRYTIMCGLDINIINSKGGNNPNKHLAYLALANSATDVWESFDIDKTIVIDDFETNVYGTYDLIDDEDYSIKRVSDYVPIAHTDGAGMMLPRLGKNRMVRLPWVKGLLGVFDYVKFIEEHSCSPIIKDVFGNEHNVIEEDIEIIFTKSQFKMWKYYDSWEQYKEYYKKYNCSAGYTNMEEDRIKDACINYQMLQTLTDITDEEIKKIAAPSVQKLENLCSSAGSIKAAFGITPYNSNKTYLQKAIDLYPDLLNDEYLKSSLREIKNCIVKKYKSGRLDIRGKYTFILPDFYAACEYWFAHIENPKGLLTDGEVFCWLFRRDEKLDCLRSPHLYREHAIKYNTACSINNERQMVIRKWFSTDALYTSCHDLISKVLQFDVDGDKSLVVADANIVSVAERNMKDVVPLYYNMKKASPSLLSNQTIYEGLSASFSKNNIGLYSNNISKIWNSDIFLSGTPDQQQEAIDIIKLLCMENNFCIDAAKTLYMPTRPDFAKDLITQYTNTKLPHFFIHAKNKTTEKVTGINNCTVNRLEDIIPNPRINCRKAGLGTINYKLLMNNPDIEIKVGFNKNGKLDESITDPLIVKYHELNRLYHFKINMKNEDLLRDYRQVISKSQIKNDLFYKQISFGIKTELSKFGYAEAEIADILVKYLYGIKKSKHKEALWFCYGNYILENLRSHVRTKTKVIQCIDCGEWFEVSKNNTKTKRCSNCQFEVTKAQKRAWKRKVEPAF